MWMKRFHGMCEGSLIKTKQWKQRVAREYVHRVQSIKLFRTVSTELVDTEKHTQMRLGCEEQHNRDSY